ncbi:rifin [Plasmodium reichenowi]|uniref:Rifin n=1 Tax=Plasmodium reichenowi TaxID=5854 RepID=A0A060RM20_PLARE|nr:rifin [Plasmodium reichenowi]
MKVHYINILLCALPLNILINVQRNHNSNTHHTRKIPTTRLLYECKLYAPANYDSDLEMKEVMDSFSKQTQQRFEEYDDRMKTTRQKCKDRCNKEIQKIILKDKLEKQMEEQLITLETKIGTNDIPTCICEKSVADKVEKGCLRCGGVLGGGVMPGMGLIDGSLLGAISVLKPAAITAAKEAALAEATDLATKAGIDAVVSVIKGTSKLYKEHEISRFISIVNEKNFYSASALKGSVEEVFGVACKTDTIKPGDFCSTMVCYNAESTFKHYANPGRVAFEETLATETPVLEATKVGAVETTYGSCQTAIIASIIAIVVIVLIMVIIYKILRYRRKKKMKKKLQYIKLLEE